jgi:hypothetical protein
VVTRELLDLCAALDEHFAAEENGVQGVDEAGRIGARAQLHGDHQRILGQLHQLADIAATIPIDVLKLRIADALDALGEHERNETRVVDEHLVLLEHA